MATIRYVSRAEIERMVRIVELYRRSDETLAGVARELGVSVDRVRGVLRRARVSIRPAAEARALQRLGDAALCNRCGILLAEALEGDGGVCGWCVKELGGGGT